MDCTQTEDFHENVEASPFIKMHLDETTWLFVVDDLDKSTSSREVETSLDDSLILNQDKTLEENETNDFNSSRPSKIILDEHSGLI